MISSMTGYGRGEVCEDRTTVVAEIRSVNSRFLEVASRLPRSLSLRENDVKELVRSKMVRGKVNVSVTVTHDNANEVPLKINKGAAKAYHKLLTQLKKSVNSREKITLDHLLKFPEVLEVDELDQQDDREWQLSERSLRMALEAASEMRRREGAELMKDLKERVKGIEKVLDQTERLAKEQIPLERQRLQERIEELVNDQAIIDRNRLELELALLVDKMDITEECVRFRSHNKFFLEALQHEDSAGRKLNFLVQEMNREANTIGSKTSSADIAHLVVGIKEELEKIREQLQNIE